MAAGTARADDLAARLKALADSTIKEDESVGIVLGVAREGQTPIVQASGRARVAPAAPMTPDIEFKAASIGKTFIAAIVLELADEGLLNLDDKLSRYLPKVPNAERVTLRQLLNHTSGYDDYITDDFLDTVHAHSAKAWTLSELLDYVPSQLLEAPGTRYDYSNTNYLLLSLVVQNVTGHSVVAEIRRHFLEPLGLTHTWFASEERVPADKLAHGYSELGDDGSRVDVTDDPWPLGGADGGMVTNAGDLVIWARTLFGGRLLSQRRLNEMLDFVDASDDDAAPGSGYGLGVERLRIEGITFYGHTGSSPGYNDMLLYEPATKTVIVIAINDDPEDEDLLDVIALRVVQAVEEGGTIRFPRTADPQAGSPAQAAPSSTPSSKPTPKPSSPSPSGTPPANE
ncbi:MAG TPA: serine hydrolase domain-containing protein [Alphaproteobacteria bacterium]|nr:serine hydrolase domain-containing protein [Alphaproteobacteria bacterium]